MPTDKNGSLTQEPASCVPRCPVWELPIQARLLNLCSVKSAGGLNTLMNLVGGDILGCCDPPSTCLTFPIKRVLNLC